MGAAARVKVMNMKRRHMKGITNLPKPTIKGGVVVGEADPAGYLLPSAAFGEYQRGAGRKYMWDNYFTQVSAGAGPAMEYRGQR